MVTIGNNGITTHVLWDGTGLWIIGIWRPDCNWQQESASRYHPYSYMFWRYCTLYKSKVNLKPFNNLIHYKHEASLQFISNFSTLDGKRN